MTDNFAGTSAQVLAVLMLTCVIEARLIIKAVERKPALVAAVVPFAIYVGAGIAWIAVMTYDLMALMWCLRSLAGSPEPGADVTSVLRAVGISAAVLILVPAATVITSTIFHGISATNRAAAMPPSSTHAGQNDVA